MEKENRETAKELSQVSVRETDSTIHPEDLVPTPLVRKLNPTKRQRKDKDDMETDEGITEREAVEVVE